MYLLSKLSDHNLAYNKITQERSQKFLFEEPNFRTNILITLCLFRWKTFYKDNFSYFPVFGNTKKNLVNGKLSLVNGKP